MLSITARYCCLLLLEIIDVFMHNVGQSGVNVCIGSHFTIITSLAATKSCVLLPVELNWSAP